MGLFCIEGILTYSVLIQLTLLLQKLSMVFCAASKTCSGVKESPLHEHRDVDMHLNARMSFSRLKYMSQDEFL